MEYSIEMILSVIAIIGVIIYFAYEIHALNILMDIVYDVLKFEIDQDLPLSSHHDRLFRIIKRISPSKYKNLMQAFNK